MMAAYLLTRTSQDPSCTTVIEQKIPKTVGRAIQEWHFAHPLLFSALQAETALAFLQDRLQKTANGLKGDSLSLSGMPPPTEIIRKVQ